MSGLATAVFAAEEGSHLLAAPRTARFAAFLRGFDEQCLPPTAGLGRLPVGRS